MKWFTALLILMAVGCSGKTTPTDEVLGPAALLDFLAIDNLTLEDLQWAETSRETLNNGVVKISGDFSGGAFTTLNSLGAEQEVVGGLKEAAAIYLPSQYPAVPESSVGFGLVWARHIFNLLSPEGVELLVE